MSQKLDIGSRARRCRRAFALVVLLAGLAACDPAQAPPRGETGALADTLTTLIEEAYDFSDPRVLERMTSLYADTDRVISASGGEITVSADSVRAGIVTFWEQAGRNMQGARWTWDEVHVDRLAADAAVLTATWSIPHRTPDGQPHVIAGAWTAVFQRIGGEWKILHEHLSTPAG